MRAVSGGLTNGAHAESVVLQEPERGGAAVPARGRLALLGLLRQLGVGRREGKHLGTGKFHQLRDGVVRAAAQQSAGIVS